MAFQQPRSAGSSARRRVPARAACAAVAAVAALALSACSGGGSEADPAASGMASPGQDAVNDGASIPTKAYTAAQSKQVLLTQGEVPGGTDEYHQQRIGVQRLDMGRRLEDGKGLGRECAVAIRAAAKNKASVLSGAEARMVLPAESSGLEKPGLARITVYTTRKGKQPAQELSLVSEKCSGTVTEPDEIAPVQRGLEGITVSRGKRQISVAAGDWGANHLLVETKNVAPEVAQQLADAQLAKLNASGR